MYSKTLVFEFSTLSKTHNWKTFFFWKTRDSNRNWLSSGIAKFAELKLRGKKVSGTKPELDQRVLF